MPINTNEKIRLRRYLLGRIESEEEKEEIEKTLMTHEEYFQELLLEEEELIQDYVDEALTAAEQKDFEKNFLLTEERQKNISFARALRKHLNNQPPAEQQQQGQQRQRSASKNKKDFRSFFSELFSRPLPVMTALLVIIALCSLLTWIFYFRSSESRQALASLNKVYQHERPLESRITDFNYAPFSQVRAEEAAEKADSIKLDHIELILHNNAESNPSAENFHLLGRFYLAEKEFDKALTQLEKARAIKPEDAAILSDIGTVYLEKSKIEAKTDKVKSIETAARALDHYEKALELNPDLLESRFNKALTLQILHSPNEERLAWQEYLNRDAHSEWAQEAGRYLELLDTNSSQDKTPELILEEFFTAYGERNDRKAFQVISRNREMIKGKLVPEQLAFLLIEAKSNNDAAQSKYYSDALEYAAQLEEKFSGDLYFSDLLKYYAAVSESQIPLIKQAHDSFKKGYQLCLGGDYGNSVAEFEAARNLFAQAGDEAEANYTNLWIAYLLFRQDKLRDSAALLEQLAEYCRAKNYKLILSHALSWLAINAGSVNRYSEEIEFNQKALQFAEEVSDLYSRQKILSQLSDNLSRVGKHREALELSQKIFEITALPEAPLRQKVRDYSTLARIFYKMRLYAAAATYKKESIALALTDGDKANFDQTAYVDLGLIYGAQEKYREADKYFAEAFRLAENIGDRASKERAIAYTKLQLAQIQRKSLDCKKAIGNYNDAVAFYDASQFKFYKYDARKGRLLCNLMEKNEAAFNEELPVILSIFREYRQAILEEQSRNNFFAAEQDVYDIAINYEFEKGNYEKAFDYSEQSRSRSLFDLIKLSAKVSGNQQQEQQQQQQLNPDSEMKSPLSGHEPLKLADMQAQIPEQVQLVQYSVLDDKVLIWLITKNSFDAYKADISARELSGDITAYLKLISGEEPHDPGREKALSNRLYQVLFGKIENRLDSGKKIGLIPDKMLFRLSFAPLISGGDGEFFISKYTFFVSPSTNVFLVCTKKSAEMNGGSAKPEKLLSVGNPLFDRQKFPRLADLPSAKREAEAITGFYDENKGQPQPLLLTDENATKEKIKENLAKSSVIHFAGHYIVDEHAPQFSRFVLAKNTQADKLQDGETLMNYEIIGERLTDTRLIVLAACQTGIESVYSGEGMIGASRTFLATGVPLVVASQWKVDSPATAKLMKQFHYYRKKEKLSTVEALRRAQLDMLETSKGAYKNPYYWAAFITLGGYSEF